VNPGFWRQNRWGLIALLPVMALFTMVALDRTDFYGRALDSQPRAAIDAASPAWVSYSGAQIRLLALSPTSDLYDTNAKPVDLPGTVRAWKASIEIQVIDQSNLEDCQILLEDENGRLFGAHPDELAGVRIPVPSCTAEDKGLNAYQVTVFFLAPAIAEPVAVRVVSARALPSYARLLSA
jgi:hypothetical protein